MILEKIALLILALFLLLCLFGCDQQVGQENVPHRPVPIFVQRFTDGDVTCYVSYQNAISCVKDANPQK